MKPVIKPLQAVHLPDISLVASQERMTTKSCIPWNMAASQVLQPPPHPLSEHLSEPSPSEVREKSVSSQLRPSTPGPSITRIQYDQRIKGFTALTVAVSLVGVRLRKCTHHDTDSSSGSFRCFHSGADNEHNSECKSRNQSPSLD